MMNAASFFSLETAPTGEAVPAEVDSAVLPDASSGADADAFATLMDGAFVRAGLDATKRQPALPKAAQPADAKGVPQPEAVQPTLGEAVPVVDAEDSPAPPEHSEPERPKAEAAQDLNALLIAQSFFAAPTLPVTWVVPAELPPSDAHKGKAADGASTSEKLAERGGTEPGNSVSAESVTYSPAPAARAETGGTGHLTDKVASLKPTNIAPPAGENVSGISSREKTSPKTGQAHASPSTSTSVKAVRTGKGPADAGLELSELGLQPVAEEETPLLVESPEVFPKLNPVPAAVETEVSKIVSRKVESEGQTSVEMPSPRPLFEHQFRLTVTEPPPAATPSSPATKSMAALPGLPGIPVVMANALQAATFPAAPITGSQAGASPVMPIPIEEKDVVKTLPVTAEQGTPVPAATETELPGATEETAILAQPPQEPLVRNAESQKSKNAVKAASGAGFLKVEAAPMPGPEPRGIPVAKHQSRMESLSNAEQAGAGPMTGGTDEVAEEITSGGAGPLLQEHGAGNLSRSLATDWPTGQPVSRSERPAPDSLSAHGSEAARKVEHLGGLVLRETTVLKLHTPDSMSVVLRPDADTELFLHLTQRDGQIEASVCCERGDFQQLNSLWSQLQESLAGQKVRLAPLQEGPSAQQQNGADQNHTPGGSGQAMNFSESDRHSRRPSMPEDESMSGRPSSAPSSTVSHHPERRRSGTRPTTSRPGWETWA